MVFGRIHLQDLSITAKSNPVMFRTDSTAKNPTKLNGSGNFTDYTWTRFQEHQEENINMLVAGFVDGLLIYIFKFCFNEPSFTSRLQETT